MSAPAAAPATADGTTFTVCVYCGSRPGVRASYAEAARTVGSAIGQRGWRLVYGGGSSGLMGIVADAALAAGAHVTGVIPESLMAREFGHRGVQELHVVQTMHERKRLMAERADVFLALPGGIGTFEELFEVWTWRQLGYHDKPLGLLDVDGYYQALTAFLASCRDDGFMSTPVLQLLTTGSDVQALLSSLHTQAASATAPDDYLKI